MPNWLKWLLSNHALLFVLQMFVALIGFLGYVWLESNLGAFIFLFYSFFGAFNLSNIFSCTKKQPCEACKTLKA